MSHSASMPAAYTVLVYGPEPDTVATYQMRSDADPGLLRAVWMHDLARFQRTVPHGRLNFEIPIEMRDTMMQEGTVFTRTPSILEPGRTWADTPTGQVTTSTRFYHVAGDGWQRGEALLCYNVLTRLAIYINPKWPHAPAGHDGSVVCVYATRPEAEAHKTQYGGTIVAVDIPNNPIVRGRVYSLPSRDTITPRLIRVREGYLACCKAIPVEWLAL